MKELVDWLQNTNEHPVKIAIEAHYKLVTIHRLLMVMEDGKAIIKPYSYPSRITPPAIIKKGGKKPGI